MGDGLGKPLDRDLYRGPTNMSSDTYFGRGVPGDELYSPFSGRGSTYTEYLGGRENTIGSSVSARPPPYRDVGPTYRDAAYRDAGSTAYRDAGSTAYRDAGTLLSSEPPVMRASLAPALEPAAHSSFSSNGVYSSNTYVSSSSNLLSSQQPSTTARLGTQGSLSEAYWQRQAMPATPVSSQAIVTQSQARPMDTIIIWDWDDTLMCSAAINRNRLPEESIRQLEPLLEQVLLLSSRLADTFIVTNADDLWVYESTRRFCPRVLPLLSHLVILSARRKHEATYPGDVFAWKRETFKEVLASRGVSGLNLIVLGDSPSEMEAAYSATHAMGVHPLVVKTVKFKEQPSCEELVEQLRIVAQDLNVIVEDSKGGNRHLASWLRPSYSYPSAVQPKSALSKLSNYPSLSGSSVRSYPGSDPSLSGSSVRSYPGSALLIQ